MNEPPMGKVILRDQKGDYLCGTVREPLFSPNWADATVFDYFQDNVQAEVQRFMQEENRIFSPIRADPPDPFELCDRCRCRVMPTRIHFTGSAFLCEKCFLLRR